MSNESDIPPAGKRRSVAAGIAARVGSVAVVLIAEMAILFLSAGRLDWRWPWVYLGTSLASTAVVGPITFRTSPEMVAERGLPGATQPRDWVLALLYLLSLYVVLPLVAGLDERFAWTQGVLAE